VFVELAEEVRSSRGERAIVLAKSWIGGCGSAGGNQNAAANPYELFADATAAEYHARTL